MWLHLATACIALAGCGRLGFATGDSGAGDDASGGDDAQPLDAPPIDTPVGVTCSTDSECGRCARCEGTCAVEPVISLHLGHRSTCYIGAGGTRWCTGENTEGQLGLGDTVNRSIPARVADGDQWERLFITYYGKSTGVRQGQFYEWADDGVLLPTATTASRDFRALLGDLYPECIWETDGTAATCPGAGTTVWHSLDFGAGHTCGVRESDRTLWCWGTNYSDALGDAARTEGEVVAAPIQVGTATNWKQVGAGGNNVKLTGSTCALDTSGRIYCFGHPNFTGTNGVDVGATPTLISAATDWAWIDVDWEHACAGKIDKTVWCWGRDTYGGYVAPNMPSVPSPTLIGTFDQWLMGGHHACGLAQGRWRCMGWNAAGQLGDGTTSGTGNLVDLCP